MKIKELPIYWDLIKLPLPVLVSRLRKRLQANKELSTPGSISSKAMASLNLPALPPSIGEDEKWSRLWQHYQQNEFNLLGSGWISLLNRQSPRGFLHYRYGSFPRSGLAPDTIDWNRDQRSGYQFDPNSSTAEALGSAFATEGVDVKFSWEFARFQHFPQLGVLAKANPGQAPAVAALFKEQWLSFCSQCPYGNGVHWASPMEVAIRMTNVLIGFDLLREQLSNLEGDLADWAYHHWHFVNERLEDKEGLGTNHYLSNLMGLVVAGYYLQDDKVKKRAKWAFKEFLREQNKQFFEDGFNFEYSTYYHRLSTEICLVTFRFAKAAGYKIPEQCLDLLSKSLHHISLLAKANGEMPRFGDTDSGRILDLDPAGEILDTGINNRPDDCGFIESMFRAGSLCHWFYKELLGQLHHYPLNLTAGVKPSSWKPLNHEEKWHIDYPEVDTTAIKCFHLADAGLILYKSDGFYLAINLMANPAGHRYRGHIHNDKASFDLRVRGQDLMQDPGVLSYTATVDLRNRYRSTAAHAVPFTGIEQNRYFDGPLGLFHSRLDVKVELLELQALSCVCRVRYRGVNHLRRFAITATHLEVTDWCNRPFKVNKNAEIPLAEGYGNVK